MNQTPKTELTGQIHRIVFQTEDTNFAILSLSTEDGFYTCKGNFFNPKEGQMWRVVGDYVMDPKYGLQVVVASAEQILPTGKDQLRLYLEKGDFPGVGPKTAENLVEFFAEDVIEVIIHHPEYLKQIKGMSDHKIEQLREAVVENEENRMTQMYLQRLGIGMKIGMRIIDLYGMETMAMIEQNPYRLIDDIDGIGFTRADDIAIQIGIDPLSAFRVQAALQYTLKELTTSAGNTYTTRGLLEEKTLALVRRPIPGASRPDAVQEAAADYDGEMETVDTTAEGALIEPDDFSGPAFYADVDDFLYDVTGGGEDIAGIGEESTSYDASGVGGYAQTPDRAALLLDDAMRELIIEQKIVNETTPTEDRIFLKSAYDVERSVAEKLIRIQSASIAPIDMRIDEFEREHPFRLGGSQREAVSLVSDNPIVLITGGPGTGKTTILKAILKAFSDHDMEAICAAPTGKAAKRMEQSTGAPAQTLHRLLGYKGGDDRFFADFNEDNPLIASAIVIDEASMLDIFLMSNFLDAITEGTRLIFVGDVDQLPSVKAGNVLKDMIASGRFKTAHLTDIYRQSEGSLIIENAHGINRGVIPRFGTEIPGNDFFVIRNTADSTPEHPVMISSEPEAVEVVLGLVTTRLPEKYGFDSIEDIQVLCLGNRGICGVDEMNKKLQHVLNPARNTTLQVERSGTIFRVGDKVMQIKNNYKAEWRTETGQEGQGVFNGDFGRICYVDPVLKYVEVDYDGRRIVYDFQHLDELKLAYAITVHKSQGSEFQCVVMPLFGSYPLMNRNLLYTGVTRASKFVALVTTSNNLRTMVKNVDSTKRQTALQERIAYYAGIPNLFWS